MDLIIKEWNSDEFLRTIQESKYYNIYFKLTHSEEEWRKKFKAQKGYEIHHIIPRCFGGDNSKENRIKLTTKEHMLAHYYLALMTNHIYMFQCFNYMMGAQFNKLSQIETIELEELENWAKVRDIARQRSFSLKARDTISKKAKDRWKEFNETGRIDEVRKNISKATKEAMKSPEAQLKVRVNLGCRWYYNPETNIEIHWYEGDPIPDHPWRRGRKPNSVESRKKVSETFKKCPRKWYYNDELKINKTFKIDEEIPEGWKPGQPYKYKKNYAKLKMQKKYDELNILKEKLYDQ